MLCQDTHPFLPISSTLGLPLNSPCHRSLAGVPPWAASYWRARLVSFSGSLAQDWVLRKYLNSCGGDNRVEGWGCGGVFLSKMGNGPREEQDLYK